MLKKLSVSLMALVVGTAVAMPAAAVDAPAGVASNTQVVGYTTVLDVGGNMYVQPWDGTKYPVKSAREGGLETAALFALPPIQPDTNWGFDRKSYQGQVIDQTLGKCLGNANPNAFGGPARLAPVDCVAGSAGQTWTFGFDDKSKTSYAMYDYTVMYTLGASQLVFARDGNGKQYPASGTAYVVPASANSLWPYSAQYTGESTQSGSNLTPILQ